MFRNSISRGLALCLMVMLATSVGAQDVSVTAQLLNPDMQVFFLSDFNFAGTGQINQELFSLTLVNQSPQIQRCELELIIETDRYQPPQLARGITSPFTLAANEMRRITNVNLFSQAREFSLQDYAITEDSEDLKDRILSTGQLPSGRYALIFRLHQVGTPFTSEDIITLNISNPSFLNLIAPGMNAEDETTPAIYTTLPLFRWESNFDRFRLTVAERLPALHDQSSPEEIIQDKIVLQRTLYLDPSMMATAADKNVDQVIPTTAFQYPADAAYPLQVGKTYYWRIEGLAPSSSRDVAFPGEIWAFRIDDGRMDPQARMIMNLLATMQLEELASFMGPGGALEGYEPTGTVHLNGQTITTDDLLDILQQLQSGDLEIVDITVE